MRMIAAVLAASALPVLASVNVNIAQQSELMTLAGLDRQAAKNLILYRNAHGPYRTLDDLANAIGAKAAGDAAPQIAFAGPAYVAPPQVPRAAPKRAARGT